MLWHQITRSIYQAINNGKNIFDWTVQVSDKLPPLPEIGKHFYQQVKKYEPTSLLDEVSIITDGLTGGGGIGRTCNIIQSGRAYFGSKPSN